jgi:anti-sigma B factor antagonist
MSLDIEQSVREGITILHLKGRLIVGDPVSKLREKIAKMAASAQTNVVLDMKDVDYIDSTGLGGMVICFTSLQKAGGALKILNMNKRNLELLLLTKLSTVFQVFNDEQDAVNSYFPHREIKKFDILSFVQQQNEAGE